ncbi:MAG: antibiotic biosynthesis monooxygenase [Flavobacteriales bacterium]|nr:antibiotic biosynthesis monooxygenase [Flavobacteriales bacterium]
MIRRIVKMTFREEHIEDFERLFAEHKDHIRSFNGCLHLELWQDRSDSRIFFTYSHWQTEVHLEAYRHSALFKQVWARTKVLFDERPEAWSVDFKAEGSQL